MEPNKNNDFVIEKIKERPISRKKLLRRTIITAMMAVMFGVIACLTFLILEPVISNLLYPKEETYTVIFPEEQEEMNPEEMLSNNLSDDNSAKPETDKNVGLDEEEKQILDFLNSRTWDIEDYAQIYSAMGEFSQQLQTYMVTVTASKSDKDWLENVSNSQTEASGVVIGNNGTELIILTNYSNLKSADSLSVTFSNGFRTDARLIQNHGASDIATVGVSIAAMGEKIKDIRIAPLGSSYAVDLVGTPVIAMGMPTGEANSVCYGMITSENGEVNMVDANFEILVTDIFGSITGTGFLFNLKGQIVGVITGKKPSTDVRYVVTAFEIGDLKKLIFKLSNDSNVPYVGITGTTVSQEVHEEANIPLGVFVKSVAMNSPAMKAGLQAGDVIVGINDKKVIKYHDYFNTIAETESNTTVTLKVMRLSVNEFKEIEINVVLSEAE